MHGHGWRFWSLAMKWSTFGQTLSFLPIILSGSGNKNKFARQVREPAVQRASRFAGVTHNCVTWVWHNLWRGFIPKPDLQMSGSGDPDDICTCAVAVSPCSWLLTCKSTEVHSAEEILAVSPCCMQWTCLVAKQHVSFVLAATGWKAHRGQRTWHSRNMHVFLLHLCYRCPRLPWANNFAMLFFSFLAYKVILNWLAFPLPVLWGLTEVLWDPRLRSLLPIIIF